MFPTVVPGTLLMALGRRLVKVLSAGQLYNFNSLMDHALHLCAQLLDGVCMTSDARISVSGSNKAIFR